MVHSDVDGAFRYEWGGRFWGALTVLLPEHLANWGIEP